MVSELGCGVRTAAAAAGLLRPHRNRGIELCRIRAGIYRWQVEGRSFTVGPGDGFVTLPWQMHGGVGGTMHRGTLDFLVLHLPRCSRSGPWTFGGWCGLDPAARRLVRQALLANRSPLLPKAAALGQVFDRCWEELRLRRDGWVGQCRALLGEMLLVVARGLARQPPALAEDDAAVRQALRTIAARLAEPWTLADMAALAGLGRTRFSERVQLLSGLSPHRWLLRTRLHAAADAIRSADGPLTALSYELGFASSQHFATAFRREFGVTPRSWRRQDATAPIMR